MALNYTVLMGHITNDLEIKQTTNGTACLTFTVAVDRGFKNANGEYDTDFITCVAWKERAEFIGRYFGKGKMIAVEGQLRSRTYEDKNGTKHHVTELYVDNASFTGEKANNYGTDPASNDSGYIDSENSYEASFGGFGGYNG
jgi:single-strand DNA-binding protein